MNYADPELRDRLASEYALGTLRGPDRLRFERLLSTDRELRDLVEEWELRLNLLAESAPSVEPPDHVWSEIARQVTPAPASTSAPASASVQAEGWLDRLWDSLGFWRAATALAAAAAAALAFYIAFLPLLRVVPQIEALNDRLARIEDATRGLGGTPSEIAALSNRLASLTSRLDTVASRPTHVAVLLDKDQRPMMTADLDTADGRLVLRLNLTPPRDFTINVLEVWLVSPDGTRRSLGLFPSERPGTTTALVLPHATAEALAKAVLSVSLEPRGGSRTGQPSGPVLFTGPLMPVSL
jgi:anti-sigma-K factor RskA